MPAVVDYLALAAVAMVLALVATPLVRAAAMRLHAVDEPGPRRVHQGRVPRLGGVAVLAALLAAPPLVSLAGVEVLPVLAAEGWRLDWLILGVVAVVAAGVLDDLRGLRPLPKLALQAAAAAAALAGGYGLDGFTNPLTGGYVELGPLTGPVTLLWIVAITNAFNLIDGLDGLAAGVAAIASATLLLVALAAGRGDAAILWALLLGALAGFLVYNFNPASIFLGDSGSLLVGYLTAVFALQSLQKGATLVVVLAPVLALGLPIMDVVLTLLRRTLAAGPWSVFRPDRDHIHHRLLSGGASHRSAVLILYGVSVAFCALAFLAVVVQGPGRALVVGAAALGTWAVIRRLGFDARARRPLGALADGAGARAEAAAGGARPAGAGAGEGAGGPGDAPAGPGDAAAGRRGAPGRTRRP